jgi:hypothetical protein
MKTGFLSTVLPPQFNIGLTCRDKGGELALQEISRKKPVLKNSSARHVPSCSVESGDKIAR